MKAKTRTGPINLTPAQVLRGDLQPEHELAPLLQDQEFMLEALSGLPGVDTSAPNIQVGTSDLYLNQLIVNILISSAGKRLRCRVQNF